MVSRAIGSAFVLKDTRFQMTKSCLYVLQIIILCFIINNLPCSKNVQVKIPGSFKNDPIWVKCASFNPFSGHTWVNFRRKCVTRNSGSKEKARWRCVNRPRSIPGKSFTECESGLQT